MLEAASISVTYGAVPAVSNVDLEIKQGEVVTLLGRNGAGKSTTLRALAGLVSVTHGHINLDGQDITRKSAHQRVRLGIGLVPEGRGLFPGLTVQENLAMGGYRHGGGLREVKEQAERVLEDFPALASRLQQKAGSLSGGEQQMLAVARGFASRPKLLLVDELSFGLAPIVVEKLYEILAGMRSRGVTLGIVEQHVGMALQLADRAYVLEKGRIVLSADAASLAKDPDLVKAYLSDGGEGS